MEKYQKKTKITKNFKKDEKKDEKILSYQNKAVTLHRIWESTSSEG